MPTRHQLSRRTKHASWTTTLTRSNQWIAVLFLTLLAVIGLVMWRQHNQTDVKGASTVASTNTRPLPRTCLVLKRFAVVIPCGNDVYRGAVYQCATGNPITIGSSTSCKSTASWLAAVNCKGKIECNNGTPTPSTSPKPTCIQRPKCLDSTPKCLIAEPRGGWCPKTTATPTAADTPTPTQ